MEVNAKLRNLRQSPRKVKLVVDLVRGLDLVLAEERLRLLPKRAAKPVLELIRSASANAVNNFKLKREQLFIKSIFVGQGSVLKRFRPRAFGRAAPLRRPSCHVTIIVAPRASPPVIPTSS